VYAIGFFQWRLNNNNTFAHNIPNNNKEEDLLELIGKYAQVKKERALCSNAKKLPNNCLKI
jgi:hypothetical protein